MHFSTLFRYFIFVYIKTHGIFQLRVVCPGACVSCGSKQKPFPWPRVSFLCLLVACVRQTFCLPAKKNALHFLSALLDVYTCCEFGKFANDFVIFISWLKKVWKGLLSLSRGNVTRRSSFVFVWLPLSLSLSHSLVLAKIAIPFFPWKMIQFLLLFFYVYSMLALINKIILNFTY